MDISLGSWLSKQCSYPSCAINCIMHNSPAKIATFGGPTFVGPSPAFSGPTLPKYELMMIHKTMRDLAVGWKQLDPRRMRQVVTTRA
ncbi:hypothetical protein VNO78_12248 [Psophocarpus tetragonolobus]|uniref:Uncharacterized protein n=1 Tax=Psophocarpus tetragonolobus TaxID=3891 RepID=A0AAN9SV66_PSOTE